MGVKEASAAYTLTSEEVCSRGYKRTDVRVIPESWSMRPLSDDIALLSGHHVMAKHCNDRGAGTPYLTGPADFPHGRIKHTKYTRNPTTLCRAGDILVTVKGSGSGMLVEADVEYCISRQLMAIRPAEWVPKFLFYSLLQNASGIKAASTGLIPGLSRSDVLGQVVPIPKDTVEQCAIAEALSDADALIETLEKRIAKQRQIKQGAMQALLTGQQRLPHFAGEWETKLLGELFNISGGYSASRDQLSLEGHCYLHYGDIHTSDKSFIDIEAECGDIPKLKVSLSTVSNSSMLDDGDVVFVDASEDIEGSSRHMIVVNASNRPFIAGLHTIVAKAKSDDLDHFYLRYCFQTEHVKSQSRFFVVGTKVSGISKTNIVKIVIRVPPKNEQTAIAQVLSDMDTEITALNQRLTKTRAIKQGMMQQLLTGRIRLPLETAS